MSLLDKYKSFPLSFGGASISGEGGGYGFGDITELDAIKLLDYAYESGFRVFDSAPIYGYGLSEIRMGKAFKQKRENVFLVSKSGVDWHANQRVNMTNDPQVTQKMLEQSLRDFDTDYIDLYMIHWPDNNVDIRKPLEVLHKAKVQGKIKHIGLCNTYKEDIERASEIDKIEVAQCQLNFFERWPIDNLFPQLEANNISFMSWGTLDKGILTGRVDEKRVFDKSDCRSWAPWWKEQDKRPKYHAMKELYKLMDQFEVSGLELALQFNLSFNAVTSLICGARNFKQVDTLISAVNAQKNIEFHHACEQIYKNFQSGVYNE